MLNIFCRKREVGSETMIMAYPKAVLILCLYILIESRAVPTTISDTEQSQNVIKQADEETVQESKLDYVNSAKLQDDVRWNKKQTSTNASANRTSKKRCGCNNTEGNGTNKRNNAKCNNGQESSNRQNKRQGNQKGEMGNRGQVGHHRDERVQTSIEETESSGYESDNSKPQKGYKPYKGHDEAESNKTGDNEGQKEENIPEKIIDKFKNVKQQILKKN